VTNDDDGDDDDDGDNDNDEIYIPLTTWLQTRLA